MTTTTNIKQLLEEGYLFEQSSRDWFTNEEIIIAAAKMAVKNGIDNENDLYDALSKQCNMSMQVALNNMDMENLFFDATL